MPGISSQERNFCLVLTGAPGAAALTAERVADVMRKSPLASDVQVRWLANGTSVEIPLPRLPGFDLLMLRGHVQALLGDACVDLNLVSGNAVSDRRKRLLVADMESTIIEQEMLDELGDLISKRDVIEDITARAMRGELDFEAALKARVAMLAGLDAGVLDEVAKRITIMPGARELIATMKANGAWCALVSGGFTHFTARIARDLGFDEHQANTLEIVDGRITGRVFEPILGREAKLDALKRIASEHGITLAQTLAVGDGANDLAMIGAAGLGVAFRAKPKVREAALGSMGGAVVSHGDLTALLYLQGYSERDLVS